MFKLLSKKGGAGFTLIELLVVIAIIGVLASIVLASLNTARSKSRDARRITDVKQIQLALELYFDGTGAGQYSADIATLASKYIPVEPKDPTTATSYFYAIHTTGSPATIYTYHLGTNMENVDNPSLQSDRDCISNVSPTTRCTDATAYAAGTIAGFNGGNTASPEGLASCNDAANTNLRCYDLVP